MIEFLEQKEIDEVFELFKDLKGDEFVEKTDREFIRRGFKHWKDGPCTCPDKFLEEKSSVNIHHWSCGYVREVIDDPNE